MNAKKQDFKNLSRVKNGIESGLSSFITGGNSENRDYNPLKEDKPKKAKQEPVTEELNNVSETTVSKNKSIVKDTIKSEEKKHSKPKFEPNVRTASNSLELNAPDDFKPHSALFSSSQLDELRNLVNFKKWKQNPKFTIQFAIYEAIEELFNERVPCHEFPNDFVTYAPAFSEKQWKKLDEEFVPEIRFIQKGQYALKYAIYEAIQMYLYNNPIKL